MNKRPGLAFCIFMDLAGMASYAFPVYGEFFDAVWAPLASYIFYRSFSGTIAKAGSVIEFLEEILPFTDFIPTFTLAYYYSKFQTQHNNK